MKVLGKTTVREAESICQREYWGLSGEPDVEPEDVVTFYLDESNGDNYLFMADSGGDYLFAGGVEEIPVEWLDAASLKIYFKATIEEFTAPGFLEKYFAEE
ncbi:MAG: hypothetical protein JRH20_30280 [Deltaproteobacteria bacterium]|nr:hypothetical protein [Deltaproteobacteria bacterium]